MKFRKLKRQYASKNTSTGDYSISESLGQGRRVSDDDLYTFVFGRTRHWNPFKRLWVAYVLSRKPWKGEVARMRTVTDWLDELESRRPNLLSVEGLDHTADEQSLPIV